MASPDPCPTALCCPTPWSALELVSPTPRPPRCGLQDSTLWVSSVAYNPGHLLYRESWPWGPHTNHVHHTPLPAPTLFSYFLPLFPPLNPPNPYRLSVGMCGRVDGPRVHQEVHVGGWAWGDGGWDRGQSHPHPVRPQSPWNAPRLLQHITFYMYIIVPKAQGWAISVK